MSSPSSPRHALTDAQRSLMIAFAEWLINSNTTEEIILEEIERTKTAMLQLNAIFTDGRSL